MKKPKDVLRVYDSGPETGDRFTVVLTRRTWKANVGFYQMLGFNSLPSHPCYGVSQFSEGMLGRHLGKRIEFEELSEELQRHVIGRITD